MEQSKKSIFKYASSLLLLFYFDNQIMQKYITVQNEGLNISL